MLERFGERTDSRCNDRLWWEAPKAVAGRLAACLLVLLLGAAPIAAQQWSFDTEPVPNGLIYVDGRYIGTAPTSAKIKIKKGQTATVTAEKPGAVMATASYITRNSDRYVIVNLIPSEAEYTVRTEPVADGRVFLDGEFVGLAPVTVRLNIAEGKEVHLRAEKHGAVGEWPSVFVPSMDDERSVTMRLEVDEAMQATEESDIANTWLTITPGLRSGSSWRNVDVDRTWQRLVSVITDSFPELEQVDSSSYYIRSAWRIREYPFRTLRHRLVVKRGVSDEFSLRVLLESQAAARTPGEAYNDEDFQPIRRVFASDSETIRFLQDQL